MSRTPVDWASRPALYLDLIRWSRPAGWLLLLWPTLTALWLASDGWPGWHLVGVFTLGTILMRSAGCCINDVADREFDKHVKRTVHRPVTSGRIGVKEALAVGAALALAALALVLSTNALTIALSVPAVLVAAAYPYAKRVMSMPQAVLGVAFSLGIPMAFAAVQGSIPWVAWVLVLSNVWWVLAYDTVYAMVDRDDDLQIGMKTAAITLGRWDVAGVAGFYVTHLLLWGLAVWPLVGGVWVAAALAAAAIQALCHVWLIRHRQRTDCFRAFRLNHWLGMTLLMGVLIQTTWVG